MSQQTTNRLFVMRTFRHSPGAPPKPIAVELHPSRDEIVAARAIAATSYMQQGYRVYGSPGANVWVARRDADIISFTIEDAPTVVQP
ncbi:MAG: hypothetical protein SGJ24_04615 [Chloroflexota bacterium]|nr:hypothetical protein [Chloroflexota bacterium]